MIVLLAALLHESSVSSSRLEIADREVRVAFTLSLEDVAGLARLDLDRDGRVDAAEWERVLPPIFAYLGDKFRLECGGERLAAEGIWGLLPPAMSIRDVRAPVNLTLRYRASRPIDGLAIRCELFAEHGGNPRHVAELPGGGIAVFDGDRLEMRMPSPARAGFPSSREALLLVPFAALGLRALRRRAAPAAAA